LKDVGPLTRVRARAEGETDPPGGESQPYLSRPRQTAVKTARRGTPGGFTAKAAGQSNRGEGWTLRDDIATGNGAVNPPVVSGTGSALEAALISSRLTPVPVYPGTAAQKTRKGRERDWNRTDDPPIRRNPEAPGPVPENRAAILRGGATETGNGP